MIINDSELRLRFIEILSQRVCQKYFDQDNPTSTPSELAIRAASETGINKKILEQLFWGEPVRLDFETKKKLAEQLDLQEDLLEVLAESFERKISKEILIHTIEEVSEKDLDPVECQECAHLDALVLDGDLHNYQERDIYQVALDLLEHIVAGSVAITRDHPVAVNPSLAPNQGSSELLPAMVSAFEVLPRSSQLEILALVYKKINCNQEDMRGLREIEVLLLFRDQYLSPLARDVFDILALGPSAGMSSNDLLEKLELSNRRSLGQLPRSVDKAVLNFNQENRPTKIVSPLEIVIHGQEKYYRLNLDTLENWRVLLRAEEKSQTVI